MHGTGLAILWPGRLLAGAGEDQTSLWSADVFNFAGAASGLFSSAMLLAREGYEQSPAMMLGLLALVVLPVLAPIGLLLRKEARIDSQQTPIDRSPVDAPARVDWIEREGTAASRHPVGYGMLRIGRQDDNDLCIDDATVHRYHAVIYPSSEGALMVADVSGQEGNGIKVNGERLAQARLKPGDCLEVGKVLLRVGAGG